MNDSLTEAEIPLLDINKLGVEQPVLATKDIIIIVFMFVLWAYSLYLTYKAWYKILYSDGEEGSNMWRMLMDVIRSRKKENSPGPHYQQEEERLCVEKRDLERN